MRRGGIALLTGVVVAFCAVPAAAQPARAAHIILPDGRALTPSGRMVAAGDFPAAALLDGGTLLTPAAGMTINQLVSVDTTTLAAVGTISEPLAPIGTNAAPWALSGSEAASPAGDLVYLGGGATDRVDVFATRPFPVQLGAIETPGWAGGVAVSQNGSRVFVTLPFDDSAPFGKGSKVVALSTATPGAASGVPATSATAATPLATAVVGRHPLAVIDGLAGGHEVVAVANRDDGTISVLDPTTLRKVATVATGRQPAALTLTPDGRELLVLDGLDDSLATVDTASWRVVSRVYVGDRIGLGAAPSAVAVSPDGSHAYVALSQDNAVAVLSRAGSDWQVMGRIPTAWYPTGVAYDAAHRQLLVTSGKGVGQEPGIPVGAPVLAASAFNPGSSGLGGTGALEAIPLPSPPELRADSALVAADNAGPCKSCDRPRELRGIDHVVYIIRENKTYDEEFGDEPGGLPAGLLYGRHVTPSTHAIADRYVLLERFFSDEDVSDTGHQAAMGGVSNDWVERFAQQSYGLDGAPRPGAELGNNDDVLWSPANYLFDDALAHGVSFRDYGEFYRESQAADRGRAVSPELDAHIVHDFPGFGFNPSYPDTGRAAFWLAQFKRDVAAHTFPSLEVIYLPEDHTTQGLPASPTLDGTVQSTPQWQVADSDLATGQIVSALSRSRYWPSTAVFLTEDDPQSGIDHINEHRTIGLLAGGRVRQGLRVTQRYDQAGMLRTIEEILGLPPLTEFDATAAPMDGLFSPEPRLEPYDVTTPTPGQLSSAQITAINHRAVAALGPHPNMDSVPPTVQRDLQWLAVRGVAFRAPWSSRTQRPPRGAHQN